MSQASSVDCCTCTSTKPVQATCTCASTASRLHKRRTRRCTVDFLVGGSCMRRTYQRLRTRVASQAVDRTGLVCRGHHCSQAHTDAGCRGLLCGCGGCVLCLRLPVVPSVSGCTSQATVSVPPSRPLYSIVRSSTVPPLVLACCAIGVPCLFVCACVGWFPGSTCQSLCVRLLPSS